MLSTNSASPEDDEVIATAQEVTASEADQATTDDPAELADESNIEKAEAKAAATTPAALEKFLKLEIEKWGRIIKDAGITPQ